MDVEGGEGEKGGKGRVKPELDPGEDFQPLSLH